VTCNQVSKYGGPPCDLPAGHTSKHHCMGTEWGEGEPVYPRAPYLFHCESCGETFNPAAIADEPGCACHCLYDEAGSGKLRNPRWVRYMPAEVLDSDAITRLLGETVGYDRGGPEGT